MVISRMETFQVEVHKEYKSSIMRNDSRGRFILEPFDRFSCVTSCRSDLGTQIEQWGLRDAGFDYNIVAVFGSQSTGKSM